MFGVYGVGVWCAMAYAWRWVGVYMACVGVGVRWVRTVCRRWVCVCMALCGERCVYVVCIVLWRDMTMKDTFNQNQAP